MLNNQSESVVVESKVEKWSRECVEQGFKWLGKVDGRNSLCECLSCGYQDTYRQDAMRKGEVACSNCLAEKWSRECSAQGFKFIHKVDGYSSLCECLTCGHVDTYEQGSMRKGKVACSNCLVTKWSNECLAEGFKFIHKVDASHSLCECLACGHQDTYRQDNMRDGKVACSNCSPGHWNEPAWFYMIKISPNDQESFVKVGISNNPPQRYTQYGLPEGSLVEELTKVLFQTKLEAVGYESAVMKFLEPFHIEPEIAKMVLTKSGWTECFTIDSLNHLLDERGFHKLSLAVE